MGRKKECDPREKRIGLLCCSLMWLAFMIGTGYEGITKIAYGHDFKQNSFQGKCTVIGDSSESCTYDCNCNNDNEACDTCSGWEYDYTMMELSICGNQTLYMHQEDVLCNNDEHFGNKQVGEKYDCYVLDCDEFSFNNAQKSIDYGIFFIVLFGMGCLCPFCYLFYKYDNK